MRIPLSSRVWTPTWWIGAASAGHWVEGRAATPAAAEPGRRSLPATIELSGSGAYGLRSSFSSSFGDVDGDGIADPLAGQAARVGDVDGDGRDDLAMEAADGSIVTLRGEALIADCDAADAATPAAHRGAWICEGQLACAVDADGDGWVPGIREGEVEVCASVRLPDGLRLGDCDDAAAAVFPGALDRLDGVDADCDGGEGLRVELPDVLGAGGTIRVETAGGEPGVRTAVLVSTAGPGDGPCPPALGGACLGLLRASVQAVDAQGGRSPVVAATIWRR
jgi:hypothetical protein